MSLIYPLVWPFEPSKPTNVDECSFLLLSCEIVDAFFRTKVEVSPVSWTTVSTFDKRAVATSNLLLVNLEYADRMICFWVNMPAYVRDFQHKLNWNYIQLFSSLFGPHLLVHVCVPNTHSLIPFNIISFQSGYLLKQMRWMERICGSIDAKECDHECLLVAKNPNIMKRSSAKIALDVLFQKGIHELPTSMTCQIFSQEMNGNWIIENGEKIFLKVWDAKIVPIALGDKDENRISHFSIFFWLLALI